MSNFLFFVCFYQNKSSDLYKKGPKNSRQEFRTFFYEKINCIIMSYRNWTSCSPNWWPHAEKKKKKHIVKKEWKQNRKCSVTVNRRLSVQEVQSIWGGRRALDGQG